MLLRIKTKQNKKTIGLILKEERQLKISVFYIKKGDKNFTCKTLCKRREASKISGLKGVPNGDNSAGESIFLQVCMGYWLVKFKFMASGGRYSTGREVYSSL